jgi:hypothetical protein
MGKGLVIARQGEAFVMEAVIGRKRMRVSEES